MLNINYFNTFYIKFNIFTEIKKREIRIKNPVFPFLK